MEAAKKICGFRGQRKKQLHKHESSLKTKPKKIGVILIPVYTNVGKQRRD